MTNAPHTEKPEECSNCQWKTTDLTEVDAYARTRGHGPFTPDSEKQWGWLCRVCYETDAGAAYVYPDFHMEDAFTLRVMARGLNYLAAIIAKKIEEQR
jgi:hypothetical protein